MTYLRGAVLSLIMITSLAAAWAQPRIIRIFPGNGQIRFIINNALDFKVAKLVSPVNGTFDHFRGEIRYDPANVAGGSIEWEVDVASINTGIAKRNHHLTTADFFDANRYPTIRFVSQSVQPGRN